MLSKNRSSSTTSELFGFALMCFLVLSTVALSSAEPTVQPQKPATARERKDSEARQTMARAEVLRADWTKRSLRQAIDGFAEAARIWIAAGDFANASKATLRCGELYFVLNEYHEALKQYENAAALARKAGDRSGQAKALSQFGRLYSYRGNNDLAQRYVNRALELLGSVEMSSDAITRNAYVEALSSLAEVTYAKGNLHKSLAQFERARTVLQHEREVEANARLFAGYITGGIGQPEKAEAEISRALELYREINNKSGEGRALTALGLVHSSRRDEDHAIQLHRSAIEIFRSIGDRDNEGIAHNALGQAFENLGEYSVALHNYNVALRLFEDTGTVDFASVATFQIARVYRLMGNLDAALAYYERCLTLSRAAKKTRTEANALNEIAMVYVAQGGPEKALKQYRRIQEFYECIGDKRGQATALNNRGDFLLSRGQTQQALDTYSRALPLSEEVGDKGILLSTLYNLARTQRDLGSHDEALSHIKRSVEIIEDLRANVGSPDLRASYFSGVRKHYELHADILMQLELARPGQGFAADALLVSDKSRARALRDLLSESHLNLREGATKELAERERTLRGLIRSLAQYQMDLSLSRSDSSEIAAVADQMAQLRSEYHEIQVKLRERTPRSLSVEQSAPLTLERIQHALRDTDTMLLEYALGDERSYLWAVTSDSLYSYKLPGRKTLEDAASELYKLTTSRQAEIDNDYQTNVEASDNLYFEKASRLSQMLLGPVAEHLGTRKLIVITEGALQYISLDALPLPVTQVGPITLETRPAQFLIETNQITALPSISTLIAIRALRDRTSSPARTVAVIADPVFSRSDARVQSEEGSSAIARATTDSISYEPVPRALESLSRGGGPSRLTYTSEEADAILAAAPRGSTMVAKGFDASRETAMSSPVGRYQIVHFATHGFLDSEHPELSSIVLSMVDRSGEEKNGLMPLHDIYSLDLSAELTVLSACQTALGKDIKGEGLVGLTHSFISAGSKSVVASLWKVDDRATAALMADFYESMLQKGMSPAAALRSAKLKIMQDKRWSAPYFWAGFVLQGEYTNRIAVESNSWFGPGLVLLLLLVLIPSALIVQKRRRRSFAVPLK